MCSRNVKYLTIVAVGDQISNKTELLLKYTGNHKSDQYEDFLRPSFQNNFQEIVVDSNPYTVYFVDVESDDDFEILRKDNYERADCILLCYSLKFRQSFKNIYKKWCIEVRRSAPFTPLVLVGTDSEAKSCGEVKELVSTEEGDNLKLLIGAYAFIECSVTKFLGIDDIFIEAYFVFEFSVTLEKFLDKNIRISVVRPGGVVRKRKVLGFVTLDVATLWYQENHQFYHKWAILSSPSQDFIGGARGYVKLDLSITAKGEVPKIPEAGDTDDIEENLLLPQSAACIRQRVDFILDIYRGEDLVKKTSISEKKSAESDPSTSVHVQFAGVWARTSVQKNTSKPVWNERLIFTELFPPLCQRFRLEIRHNESTVIASKNVDIKEISCDKPEGFLPVFGPSFIHFYSKDDLEGYVGKVLISLKTELKHREHESDVSKPTSTNKSAPDIKEDEILRFADVSVFATIIEANCIPKRFCDKQVSFRLACGTPHRTGSGDSNDTALTPPLKPKVTNKYNCHLDLEDTCYSLSLTLKLQDHRKILYAVNMLWKTSETLKAKLDTIETIFEKKDYKTASDEADGLILDAIDFVVTSCVKFVDIASTYDMTSPSELQLEETSLDRKKLTVFIKQMSQFREDANAIYEIKSKKKCFQKLEKLYNTLFFLIDDVEVWPKVYIWMIYGSKRVAYYKFYPEDLTYSAVEEERGIYCGLLQNIYLQTANDCQPEDHDSELVSMICQMRVIIWMGLQRQQDAYVEFLPKGFQRHFDEGVVLKLTAEEKHEFQCRAHIFQGRFAAGWDLNGLADPFVHVVVGGHYRESEIVYNTLNPIWDQTLTFNKVTLHGSIDFIASNPPSVLVEVYDRDQCYRNELVGKSRIKPIVKSLDEPYGPPIFPPKLSWYKLYNKFDVDGEILAAFELLELSAEAEEIDSNQKITQIPEDIKPNLVSYRIEVYFWGVRNLKKVQMVHLNKPNIVVQCGSISIKSDTLFNAKKCLNFMNPIKIHDVTFAEQPEYAPTLSLKMFDKRSFGVNIFSGTYLAHVVDFLYTPMTEESRNLKIVDTTQSRTNTTGSTIDSPIAVVLKIKTSEKKPQPMSRCCEGCDCKSIYNKMHTCCKSKCGIFKKICEKLICCKSKKQSKKTTYFEGTVDENVEEADNFDWWTKFYASIEKRPKLTLSTKIPIRMRYRLKVYTSELEAQEKFEGFSDILASFPMYKGKRTGDMEVDEENTTGVLKGQLRIYRWPPKHPISNAEAEETKTETSKFITRFGKPLEMGIFSNYPKNSPLMFVLRVYIVRGIGLRPKDLNGKSDPYLFLKLTNRIANDKENVKKRQVNPIFGSMFEFSGIFPRDHTLLVALYDWDLGSADDLIGETRIDLENRLYTHHRGHCGLPQDYLESGYCKWRDPQKPTIILDSLCKKWNLRPPTFGSSTVQIMSNEFRPKDFVPGQDAEFDKEVLALYALNHWQDVPVAGCHLVPEHVETRSLYNPNKPGIEQGKLQMWIDILPVSDVPTPLPVEITPREAVEYELRVIIWNTENIPGDEDDFFTGERKSDIYVKGWMIDPENAQYTDVHYRSLTGEGNFNWRFIFHFDYIATENKIVVKKKENILALDKTEFKIPCLLTLQVWDNDTFSPDDFLGVLNLELAKMPRGAHVAKKCNLGVLRAPAVNLFKIRRTKAWWPFINFLNTGEKVYAGCVEVEMEILLREEAKRSPAGRGRDEPQALPPPNRPDTSFNWLMSPLVACKYASKLHKWKFIKALIVLLLILVLVLGFYAIPGYTVKRVMGA